MKTHTKLITTAAICILGMAAGNTSQAQQYAIEKYTIDSGGGTSSGGTYSVTGTIGQPDASGVSSSGKYTVSGGYWGGLLTIIPTTGAPELTITPSGKTSVKLTWKDPDDAWVLSTTSSLKTGDWKASTFPMTQNGAKRSATVALPASPTFFRLQKR
ncbi:MAG: hypothetical protein KDN22_23490 [Verrucomicrobiae bacterium]|nr:hypothetical protein [Verrucomicrobiae bacterium]